MIWFTSDTHFFHENIIEYSKRPFGSLEEMHETMIHNWNERVQKGDTVYHLGDFALTWKKTDADRVAGVLDRLNGQKWLIIGNHDRDEVIKQPHWVKATPYHEIKADLGGLHKQRVVLCHYAMRTWNQQGRGAWMLHGHSHGTLPDIGGHIIDVGVDPQGMRPISIEEVQNIMECRDIVAEDHHA
jgi:calcineurin-like phosphoesterase family protein